MSARVNWLCWLGALFAAIDVAIFASVWFWLGPLFTFVLVRWAFAINAEEPA